MRIPVPAILLALLAALAMATPVSAASAGSARAAGSDSTVATAPAHAAGAEPKVVIIVGAVHGSTDKFRGYADKAYAEAIKHTSNVTKVYSPNATWSKVKAATAGASVVIYMGHGNGWPSPYTYDPNYTTKNGFGLNATAGDGDHNNKYYGEPYVSTLDLAPNAVILLHHLCYASGNSEPGHAEPTLSVARQRIDNYAAGFLKTRARAVIADGHAGPESYLNAIFTTNESIETMWRTRPNANGNVSTFASSRTAGADGFMDPKTTTTGFYRSLVGDRALATNEIRGAGVTSGPTPFTDIAGTPFESDITWLYLANLTTGCAPKRYCPDGTVTRGEMASFLARALELPATAVDAFDDDQGSVHQSDINRLAAAGVTGGCGPGRFCPAAVVSRAEMASFLARALDLPATTVDAFADDTGSVHEADINRLVAAGVTGGCGPGRYCPDAGVTRGQMAAFIRRAFDD